MRRHRRYLVASILLVSLAGSVAPGAARRDACFANEAYENVRDAIKITYEGSLVPLPVSPPSTDGLIVWEREDVPGPCFAECTPQTGSCKPSEDEIPRNGEYPCGTAASSNDDPDGDRSPNAYDDDDDCDHLADELEAKLETASSTFDTDGDGISDVFDLLPTAARNILATVSIARIEQVAEKDPFCFPGSCEWGDPYIDETAGISLVHENAVADRLLGWAKLSKNDHYSNMKVIDLASLSPPYGPEAHFELPADFLSPDYLNRDSATDFPKLALNLPLWDDDGGFRGGDDQYARFSTLVFHLLQIARRASSGEPVQLTSQWGETAEAKVTVTLTSDISACVLLAASLVSSGADTVYSSMLANQANGGQC